MDYFSKPNYIFLSEQVLRHYAWLRIEPLNIPFKPMAQFVLLMIIYSAFCDTFQCRVWSPHLHLMCLNTSSKKVLRCGCIFKTAHFEIQSSVLAQVVCMVVVTLILFSMLAFWLSNRLGYTRKDVICITFCGTHKSLTLGEYRTQQKHRNTPNGPMIRELIRFCCIRHADA